MIERMTIWDSASGSGSDGGCEIIDFDESFENYVSLFDNEESPNSGNADLQLGPDDDDYSHPRHPKVGIEAVFESLANEPETINAMNRLGFTKGDLKPISQIKLRDGQYRNREQALAAMQRHRLQVIEQIMKERERVISGGCQGSSVKLERVCGVDRRKSTSDVVDVLRGEHIRRLVPSDKCHTEKEVARPACDGVRMARIKIMGLERAARMKRAVQQREQVQSQRMQEFSVKVNGTEQRRIAVSRERVLSLSRRREERERRLRMDERMQGRLGSTRRKRTDEDAVEAELMIMGTSALKTEMRASSLVWK
jgi:hypothetical protein